MTKLYLGTDVGGSLSKIFSISNGTEKFGDLNNYVWEHDGYINTQDHQAEDEGFKAWLDLSIRLENSPQGDYKAECLKITSKINNTRWLLGTLATSVSANANKLPIGVKVKQYHFYLNIIAAIVVNMEERRIYDTDLSLGVLLPARQYFQRDKVMIQEILGGKIVVKNNLTNKVFTIRLNKDEDIMVKPEAVVAINSCFIENGKLTDFGKEFATKFNLVIDIGENTTDIAGVRGSKPESLSFHSFEYAGGLLIQYIEQELQRKFGYYPSRDEVLEAISTGYVTQGAGKEWVGEEISEANRLLAEKLFTDFTQIYLLTKNYRIQQIASFIFVGGGSIKLDKIKSVGKHFIDLVKEQSKNAVLFSPKNIRQANIKGLADLMRKKYKDDTETVLGA